MAMVRRRTTDDRRRIKSLQSCPYRISSVICRLSSVVRSHPFCRIERGGDDILIAGAAAQIAGYADADVFFGRVGIVAQKLDQRGQDARRAESALQTVMLVERLLQRVQGAVVNSDALDRQDLVPVGLHREHQARSRRIAVEENGAGAAHAVLAAEMGAGQAELMAQEIRQRHPHRHGGFMALAVDGDGNASRLAHGLLPLPMRSCALTSARRDSTVAKCRRYDAGAWISSMASSLRNASQISRSRFSAMTSPISARSTSPARTGAGPMPPSASDRRVTLPLLSSSISAAAETMAKSPCRRANSTKATPWPAGQHGKVG